MPFYRWKCEECGDEVDVRRNVKDYERGPDVCKACGSKSHQRIVESKTFILKGGGWHDQMYTKTRSRN